MQIFKIYLLLNSKSAYNSRLLFLTIKYDINCIPITNRSEIKMENSKILIILNFLLD
jgi:hypothetical protein